MKSMFYFFVLFPLLVSAQKGFIPDTSVIGVSLMNSQSFERRFSKSKLPKYFEADHPPKLEFISPDKSKKFTVFHCYGGYKNEICTFRVEYRKKSDSIPVFGILIVDKDFKTGKGIYLGMPIEEFKKKIGTTRYKSVIDGGKTKITIEIDDFKDNDFLQSYNMPSYLAEYYFKHGKLIVFEFGFPTP